MRVNGVQLAKSWSSSSFTPHSRSSIQHLSNWPCIGDSTSRSILHLFQQLSDRHPIHLQWVPSLVGLSGNEVADDLAKAATSHPVDPEDHMVLTSTDIYSKAKELICRIWVVPPVHPWYFQRHPGSAISFKGFRSYQTAFSRFSTGHLRCMNFEGGKRSFPICNKCSISPFSPQHILQCLGFFCEETVASPPAAVPRLCTHLWALGSGLVSLDQMGISPTTIHPKFVNFSICSSIIIILFNTTQNGTHDISFPNGNIDLFFLEKGQSFRCTVLTASVRRKAIFGSRAASKFSFGEKERPAQRSN
ncbi:RNase H domain-containing protein [Trichonephila clavipes]|nr:RNase H domain-containing protein [Trichonephila clavipes]